MQLDHLHDPAGTKPLVQQIQNIARRIVLNHPSHQNPLNTLFPEMKKSSRLATSLKMQSKLIELWREVDCPRDIEQILSAADNLVKLIM
ncbi:hypothetical protein ABIF21_006959 [Bradyrhizobium elkanii]|uniref:hypothetical protein n=1 Tax=Bradyrhizobium elkanii TaxID=29448 RepID=UPI0035182CC6